MRSRTILPGILAAAFLLLVGGCLLQSQKAQQEVSASRQIVAMDTVMSFEAYGKNAEEAVAEAVKEVQRLDELFSTGKESSEVSLLNDCRNSRVSEDTLAVLQEALFLYEDTKGLFDPTIYLLMKLWGFTDKQYHVPDQKELDQVLPLVDASKVQILGNQVTLGEGQMLDLGGIAKGYASGRLMEIYREYGITSGQVSLGGNVQVLGVKPDGTKWKIGIRDPEREQGQILASVQVQDQAVITSGGYERYFEEDGNTYIHILDPRTGCPADGDLASVTVISGNGMLADGLSTALYLMGKEEACSYWRKHPEDLDLVLVTKDGALYVTEGIAEDFHSEKSYEVVKR